jgi:hypothetical protein
MEYLLKLWLINMVMGYSSIPEKISKADIFPIRSIRGQKLP